ncbi:MAG TPA: hypothetical protein VGI74_16100 [Streptosporangiaceae bacterium]
MAGQAVARVNHGRKRVSESMAMRLDVVLDAGGTGSTGGHTAIAGATQDFESLEEPEDWSVAHQKLALAYLAAGDLNRASQYIDIALANRLRESPLQQVRLDTAHAHILLSDRRTCAEGVTVLARAEQMAVRYGLSRQLQSIERIGQLAAESALVNV